MRTSASARRRAGVRVSFSEGGSVRAWRAVTTISAPLDDRSAWIKVRPSYPDEIVTPSCARGSVPSARAQFRKCVHARRNSRWSSARARRRKVSSSATSFTSCPSTRAPAIVRTAPVVTSPSRHACPIFGSSSDTSPVSIDARASPSRIPVCRRSHACVDGEPSTAPIPRWWPAHASCANSASSRSISARRRTSSSAISTSHNDDTSSTATTREPPLAPATNGCGWSGSGRRSTRGSSDTIPNWRSEVNEFVRKSGTNSHLADLVSGLRSPAPAGSGSGV